MYKRALGPAFFLFDGFYFLSLPFYLRALSFLAISALYLYCLSFVLVGCGSLSDLHGCFTPTCVLEGLPYRTCGMKVSVNLNVFLVL